MTEFIYGCTLKKFNGEVSEYLSKALGEPTIRNNENRSFQGFSYSSKVFKDEVEVKVKSDYQRGYPKNNKYLLESHVQITIKADIDSPVREGLEKILEKK